jgi:hypothetical protein
MDADANSLPRIGPICLVVVVVVVVVMVVVVMVVVVMVVVMVVVVVVTVVLAVPGLSNSRCGMLNLGRRTQVLSLPCVRPTSMNVTKAWMTGKESRNAAVGVSVFSSCQYRISSVFSFWLFIVLYVCLFICMAVCPPV